MHSGVEMGQIAPVFFMIKIGKIQLAKTPYEFFLVEGVFSWF